MSELSKHHKAKAARFIALKRESDQLLARVKQLQAELVATMTDAGIRSVAVGEATLTLVPGTTYSYDVEALRATVDDSTFKACTKTVVDGATFNALVKSGLVNPAGIRTGKPKQTSLRVS